MYALPGLGNGDAPGGSATLTGTLMEVVAAARQPDQTIALICQCRGRAVVLRGTQALPYSRVDCQLLPDTEQLLLAAARGATGSRPQSAGTLAGMDGSDGVEAAVSRQGLLAAAIGQDRIWESYDFAPVDISRFSSLPAFASFAPDNVGGCARRAAKLEAGGEAESEAGGEAATGGAMANGGERVDRDQCMDQWFERSAVVQGVLKEAVAAAEADAEEVAEVEASLAALEVRF